MQIFVDTNVLLRSATSGHEHHAVATDALRQLKAAGERLIVSSQCIYEYFVVATRSIEQNGLGLTVSRTLQDIDDIQALFTVIHDSVSTLSEWRSIVDSYQVVGKRVHDAHILATMVSHDITCILTFNHADFQQFEQVSILNPSEVACGSGIAV